MNENRELLNIVKEELGLPDNTKFVGFVVHLPDTDEFLGDITRNRGIEKRMWSKVPDLAKIYKNRKKAEREAMSTGKGAVVGILLDIGDQYVFAIDTGP
ncbi:MAG: hypothetical protein RPU35_02430 [Candidatus Sedimenticola sp. (ex Thyasira tokunagai)]